MKVSDSVETSATGMRSSDAEMGDRAARLIWADEPRLDEICDPRNSEFAAAVIDGLGSALASSSGAIRKVISGAARAAEDLNVAQFQGLVEVIQNADDVCANEVRFMLRTKNGRSQLLVAHDGQPVTCQHVLSMALPFLTTKTRRVDQLGRFGIGLKTLGRIAKSIDIHSAPYHFSGDQLSLRRVEREAGLPNFYSPATDTLLVLDLNESFAEEELQSWFEAWEENGLIFLGSVSRFRWCAVNGETLFDRAVEKGGWKSSAFDLSHKPVLAIRHRCVRGQRREWKIWNATVSVPSHLRPARKSRSETTEISVAVPDRASRGSIYIGLKTRVSAALSLSLDAQFDPSTAREQLIENDWNNWLIDRCADLLGDVASGLLLHEPRAAWKLIPIQREKVGSEADSWLRGRFDIAFERVRNEVGTTGSIAVGQEYIPLSDLAYEDESLGGLLAAADIEVLVPESRALSTDVRDESGRWREILQELDVATEVGTTELVDGFMRGLFADKDPVWRVEASRRLTANHTAQDELFGVPFWLTDDERSVPCQREDDTARPLLLGDASSTLSARWKLLNRLHDAYARNSSGKRAIEWLEKHAAFTTNIEAATELAAFAERFASEAVAIGDEDLRAMRDRFDKLPQERATEIGPRVGAALLLDGYVHENGKPQKRKVSPVNAYLGRSLDSDSPNWPTAAGTISDIEWIAPKYSIQLKTGATRTSRRRADGTISRGPRKFLMLLGVECTPRLVKSGNARWGRPTREKELRSARAEEVTHDFKSPDLKRVLAAIKKCPKKETKTRSPALLRALSRNWARVYSDCQSVPSQHHARVYSYPRAAVTADWLIDLREEPWIAVGRGQLLPPGSAVIKSAKTQTLYPRAAFAVGVKPTDIGGEFAAALGLITDVRLSDLVKHLADVRDGEQPINPAHVLQIYRSIARVCPNSASWNTRVGDMTVQMLRTQFSEGVGLIHSGGSIWHRPADLLRGEDIFHDHGRFVPGGPACSNLWSILDVREPTLDDCIAYCRGLSAEAYNPSIVAVLIDIFRYMEPLLSSASRSQKNRLKALPLVCSDSWESDRPIYYVDDPELRRELATTFPGRQFWTPPCDMRNLPNLVKMTRVTN